MKRVIKLRRKRARRMLRAHGIIMPTVRRIRIVSPEEMRATGGDAYFPPGTHESGNFKWADARLLGYTSHQFVAIPDSTPPTVQ